MKSASLDLREIGARTTLRHFRLRGHLYVDLRRVGGKRSIYFCTLCQVQCFNDSVLSDHLGGHLHSRRLAAARITLLGPNPWPFSDGVFFFTNPRDAPAAEAASNLGPANGGGGGDDGGEVRFIPGVLMGEEVSNLKVKSLGYGHVGSKIQVTEGDGRVVPKVWCAWLGRGDSELLSLQKSDFAMVTFLYTNDLGRKLTADELEASYFQVDDSGTRKKRRKKSFSDPEDSSGGSMDGGTNGLRVVPGLTSRRAVRRELRKQKSVAAERTCDICRQLMLPGKDVSTLLNCKTGRLFCSSRNSNGAFHLFHTSCLIHWILQCEFELWINGPALPKPVTRGRKAKLAQKNDVISSVFCPECQGTGIRIEGEEFEKPTVILPKMFLYKLEAIKAHNAWMKNPEDLQKCSTGLHFEPNSPEKFQGKAMLGKLLQFYRADE
ncbi:uncharacterized protein M6B38_139240 [Iris pallida]|uniref:C2H2-type domain-containing protein n=1 Tax=Iris pallida TaxID=29817 RepID=A0AAX6FC81_IRIPA|nr:uncharacterized protein M6B38_139240 [Iris pallida]